MNLNQDISFIIEIDRLKSVYRKALVKHDSDRFENSAEHSWHAAMTALTLKSYFINLTFDLYKAIKMLLLHDIVEIDAGDTFVYTDKKTLNQQSKKELLAAKRIFSIPKNPLGNELYSLWCEFNENTTDTSIFANAIDKITPFILNVSNNGGTWKNYKIDSNKVRSRNKTLKIIAPELWSYLNYQIDEAVKNGLLHASP